MTGIISASGIGSGLDVDSIVSKLIELESRPITRLETRKELNDIKISSFGQLSSALAELQTSISQLKDSSSLVQYQANSSDTTVFTATADSSAAEESHSIEVVSLASAHRLNSTLFSGGESEVIGEGELTIASGSNSFTLTISSGGNTLAGIRDAINNASDNTSVSASIVNVDGGSRLVLNANNTGLSNAISISVSGDTEGTDTDMSGLSRLVYDAGTTENMIELQAAGDALVKIDGFDVSSDTNTISGALTGTTLNLIAEGSASLSIAEDYSVISGSITDMVSAYNAVDATIKGLGSTSLSGENFLLSLERQLRDIFATRLSGLGGGLESVFDVGLTFDKEGTLSFDSSKLDTALNNDTNAVIDLFADSGSGFAVKLDNLIDNYLGSSGLIQSRTDGLTARNEDLDKRIEILTERVGQKEEQLYAEYGALDTLMAQFNSTSEYLTTQLNQLLNNISGK